MVDIPTIEPFQFIRSTAFSERVQLANKLNEVIDALNKVGNVDDLQTQIDTINSEISEIQTAIGNTDTSLADLENQVNTLVSEVSGLLKEVVNEVVLDAPEYGQVRVKVIHEDETGTASNALQIPVIVDGGISLISGTTARSFKIRYITADGVTHTTNDFVIPEGGGGTDVTVTSITILEGDTDNSFKFEVGLSDGSSIQSNSYPFPAASELTPATTSQLGGIKVGTHLTVTADGTLSVDMTTIGTAAAAPTVMWTADPSKVTLHFDSLTGTEYTKDIPTAASGGAGTIDQASYAKIAATEAKVNALAPTVTVNEDVSPAQITVAINGKSSTANLPSSSSPFSFILLRSESTQMGSILTTPVSYEDSVAESQDNVYQLPRADNSSVASSRYLYVTGSTLVINRSPSVDNFILVRRSKTTFTTNFKHTFNTETELIALINTTDYTSIIFSQDGVYRAIIRTNNSGTLLTENPTSVLITVEGGTMTSIKFAPGYNMIRSTNQSEEHYFIELATCVKVG